MARVKGAMMARKRRNKTLKLAKGYWGAKSKHFKMANEQGLVSSVFTSPKSEAARHLVFPGGEDMTVSDPLHERRLKLTFLNVAATSVPLVARLATEEGISANVISATTQKLSDEIYGSMLLGIPNSQFDKATAFLKNFENIKVEEVSADD